MSFQPDNFDSPAEGEVQVLLDGQPVSLPSDRRSLAAIRSYLDTLALEQQRILCSLSVDGQPADTIHPVPRRTGFRRVEGESLDLEQLPLQFIRAAMQQTTDARARVESAIPLVLINEGRVAREFWWDLTRMLREPLLTLSLLPEHICGPAGEHASFTQLRRWQLQQLAAVLRDVDQACWSEDMRILSNALEHRALPWLENLKDSLALWHETLLAGSRASGRRP
jgi:hypothetical protein